MTVRVLNGAAQTQNGATALHTSGTTPTIALTTTTVGSWVYGCMMDLATNQAALTANAASATAGTWFNNASDGETAAAFKALAATTTPGATTYGWSAGAADTYMLAAFEVLPATATGPVSNSLFTTRIARNRAAIY
jgi:hypothetical protein